MTRGTAWGLTCLLVLLLACNHQSNSANSPEDLRGYYTKLHFLHDGQQLSFGPFVGYYFKPLRADDMSRLTFVCYNEQQFYSDEVPPDEKLFEGEAVLTELPGSAPIPTKEQRINPVFFENAPPEWLATRPDPRQEFIHFHSSYNQSGATLYGYWLRHVAVRAFTYNMGGRVDTTSPLYHRAAPGKEGAFPAIIEFDYGPVRP